MHKPRWYFMVLFVLAFAMGCRRRQETAAGPSSETPQATSAANEEADREAREIFANRCAPCHGPQGAGDGPASAGLTPRPRNFQDRNWQNSVSDDHIDRIIQYGGAAVGRSPAMPANPDLVDRPAVVAALRRYIRSLAR